jgi:hypothetical protein
MRMLGDVADLVLGVGAATGLASALHDPAALTLAASPTTRWRRLGARFAILIPVVVTAWLVGRALAAAAVLGPSNDQRWVSLWVPTREAWLVMVTVILFAVALEARWPASGSAAGVTGAAGALVFAALALFLPPRWSLIPVTDRFGAWVVVVLVAGTGFAWATADPGRSRDRMNRGRLRARQSLRGS